MKRKGVLRAIIALFLTAALAAGIYGGIVMGVFNMGNYGPYTLKNTTQAVNSPLHGKTVLFLGSSVTYGFASMGVSFADFLEQTDGIRAVKEAVSGTTLADIEARSYIARLKKMDATLKADCFVCQLSTNDATKNVPLGVVSAGFSPEAFDTATVAGAIEYIIYYARETWGCPVAFYTQTRYDSERYALMTALLDQICQKWDVAVIDLWNDAALNDITPEERNLYLADQIHPTKAGYRDWWLPKFREALIALCGQQDETT